MTGIGDIVYRNMHLKLVLQVPNLQYNLLSASKLTKDQNSWQYFYRIILFFKICLRRK